MLIRILITYQYHKIELFHTRLKHDDKTILSKQKGKLSQRHSHRKQQTRTVFKSRGLSQKEIQSTISNIIKEVNTLHTQ